MSLRVDLITSVQPMDWILLLKPTTPNDFLPVTLALPRSGCVTWKAFSSKELPYARLLNNTHLKRLAFLRSRYLVLQLFRDVRPKYLSIFHSSATTHLMSEPLEILLALPHLSNVTVDKAIGWVLISGFSLLSGVATISRIVFFFSCTLRM